MIRKATEEDLSRIAEIFVFNNRINYFPIFKSEEYSFGELQVVSMIDHYFGKEEVLENLYVADECGMRETTLKEMLAKKPERVIELAVKGMLPKGPLGRSMYTKLFVYAGPEHKHEAQKPEALTF